MKEMEEYQIRKPGQKAKATITQIKLMKAGDVYKKGAKNPEQLLYVIYAKEDGWEGRIATIPKPPSKQISPNCKLAKFMLKYKKTPEVGMAVDMEANSAGYWKLQI